jgi:hypothetical protein
MKPIVPQLIENAWVNNKLKEKQSRPGAAAFAKKEMRENSYHILTGGILVASIPAPQANHHLIVQVDSSNRSTWYCARRIETSTGPERRGPQGLTCLLLGPVSSNNSSDLRFHKAYRLIPYCVLSASAAIIGFGRPNLPKA